MSFLTGSSPKASFSTQPTILPQQQSILDTLSSILSNALPNQAGGYNVGAQGFGNLFTELQGAPTSTSPQQTTVQDSAFNTLLQSLGFQAPSVTAPQGTSPGAVTPQTVTAQQIDPTAAFKSGVVQPMTDDFLARTLPAIAGQAGGSAGGAYGSGAAASRQTAATNLERTLSQTGSQYALGAQQANQNANLNAAEANQSAGLQAGIAGKSLDLSTMLANLQAQLTAGVSNQGAATQSNQQRLAALGLSPTVSTLPETTTGANIGLSTAGLDSFFKMLASMIGASTGGTQQTVGVGSGGSTGLLGGLLGNAGLGSAIGGLFGGGGSSIPAGLLMQAGMPFSDRRLKDDIEEIGAVDGLPLYRFRYKGAPARHIGFMADEVEKKVPSAVVTDISGYKKVNYGTVLESVLREAA